MQNSISQIGKHFLLLRFVSYQIAEKEYKIRFLVLEKIQHQLPDKVHSVNTVNTLIY